MSSLPRWNPRSAIPLGLAALLCAPLVLSAGGLTTIPTLKLPARTAVVTAGGLSAAERLQEFNRVLAEKGTAQANVSKYSADFQKLPAGLQMAILQRTSPRVAINRSSLVSGKYVSAAAAAAITKLLTFDITSVFPTDSCEAGTWCAACGHNFNASCVALIDGSAVPSQYITWDDILPNSLWFEVPTTVTYGASHNLAVRNNATNRTTSAVTIRVIAERGYRGWSGWKFSNFGNPTIPWTAYRDYFGASNVEYGDGTHRPAAQTWYDDHYKGSGGGGNCYGMSVSSLRYTNGLGEGYWNGWFHTSPNPLGSIWNYAFVQQTRETVQEYQGSWLSEEVLNTHAVTQTQGAQGCFNRVASFVGTTHECVLVMWGHGLGHAIVPYRTNIAGDDHQMSCYDNNYPYSETETNPDPNVAHVAWAANTFSDPTESWATWAECMSYAEVTPATPHLPGSEYGGPGSTVVAAALPGTQVSQITDEAGHTFFNADGSPNMNPATRIPNSAIVYPLVAPLLLARATPPAQPILFVFSQAGGKSLTFQVGGTAALRRFQLFAPGISYDVGLAGAGQIRALDLLRDTRSLELVNPAGLRPSAINVTHSKAVGDRVFLLRNLIGLGTQSLFLRPLVDGSKLNIQGPASLRFDLNLLGPLGQGQRGLAFTGVATGAPNVSIAMDDWEARTSNLSLQHLNAAGGLQQQLHLAPAR